MNVLFIYSVKDSSNPLKPVKDQQALHFGISYISSFLQAHHHQTRLFVVTNNTDLQQLDETIAAFAPALVCFTSVASEYHSVRRIAEYLKARYPQLYLLAGGTHVSLNPETSLRDAFDAICIGEGEQPTLDLVNQLSSGQQVTGIQNLWIKHSHGIEKNPTREFLPDLDQLPFPDRTMWQPWIEKPWRTKQILLLGRGCPFQCTYCCNHALLKIAPGKYVRFRSPENVVRELQTLVDMFPETDEVYFEVETIGANLPFAMALSAQLREFNATRPRPLSFGVNLRITPGKDYHELFEAFRSANFTYIKVGVESGSPHVRREILHRHYSNEDLIQALHLAKEYGLRVYITVMVGLPGETLRDFQESIQCVKTIQPYRTDLAIFYPYPGTQLHKRCEELGVLTPSEPTGKERAIARMNLPGFSKWQIQKQYDWFSYHVRQQKRPSFSLLKPVILRRLSSYYLFFFAKAVERIVKKRPQ